MCRQSAALFGNVGNEMLVRVVCVVDKQTGWKQHAAVRCA